MKLGYRLLIPVFTSFSVSPSTHLPHLLHLPSSISLFYSPSILSLFIILQSVIHRGNRSSLGGILEVSLLRQSGNLPQSSIVVKVRLIYLKSTLLLLFLYFPLSLILSSSLFHPPYLLNLRIHHFYRIYFILSSPRSSPLHIN